MPLEDRERAIAFTLNGEAVRCRAPTRVHLGCEHGVCGACTVLLDGRAVRACLVLGVQADGARVETVEGLTESGRIRDLQDAFHARNALQCGYCTPGMLVTAAELLDAGGSPEGAPGEHGILRADGTPDRAAIRAAISGNYCRCTGYHAIVDAIGTTAQARAAAGAGATARREAAE